jgi:hypothetical protein
MNIHPSRVLAGLALGAAGFIICVTALAIVLARLLVDAGMPIAPGDVATLDDVVALLPFVGAFAIANIVAAVGLVIGNPAGRTIGLGTAIVAVAVGTVGLVILVVGGDPVGSSRSAQAMADGLGIVGTFTLVYLGIIAALTVGRLPATSDPAVAA